MLSTILTMLAEERWRILTPRTVSCGPYYLDQEETQQQTEGADAGKAWYTAVKCVEVDADL